MDVVVPDEPRPGGMVVDGGGEDDPIDEQPVPGGNAMAPDDTNENAVGGTE